MAPPQFLSILATCCVAFLGGVIAKFLGIPLPWMLGPLLITAAVSFFGIQIFGNNLSLPPISRTIFVPMIGLMIGSRVSPDILSEMAGWWPSLMLIPPFAIIVQLINYQVFHRLAGYDKTTAFFSASPGGLIEAVLLGEKNGGDTALMAIQHFARVALSVSIIPLILNFTLGNPVGSAAGVIADSHEYALELKDIILLFFAAIIGVAGAKFLRLPAAIMFGPFLVSTILHAGGVTAAEIPSELVNIAQLVIGTTLGTRFAGQNKRAIIYGFGISLVALFTSLAMAFGVAYLIYSIGIAAIEVGLVSFAPGGLVEMSLIAISLGADPVFVATHHIVRITCAVILAPMIFNRFIK